MLFNLILWDEMQEAAQGMSEHVTLQFAHKNKLWLC